MLFVVLQPYRTDFYNRLDCMFFGLLTLGNVCLLCNEYIIHLRYFSVILYFLGMIDWSVLHTVDTATKLDINSVSTKSHSQTQNNSLGNNIAS